MENFFTPKPYDMHLHLRDEDRLKAVAPITAEFFRGAVIMPNLTPPVCSVDDVIGYKARIMNTLGEGSSFNPLMTFKIMPETTRRDIVRLADGSVVAGKLYPKNLTTNAHDGIEDFFALHPVYSAMAENGIVLCIHGEMPGDDIEGMNRESAFLRTLKVIAKTHPSLKIVMEHITTEAAVDAVLDLDNVSATITVHHLLLNHDDVGGDRMCPGHYCKPVAKMEKDRKALVWAATSGCPKFFFGSDSAPHPEEGKARLYDCCAGIFTAPVALPLLAQIFECNNALDRLQPFVGQYGKVFYEISENIAVNPGQLLFEKKHWTVPEKVAGIPVFWAGQQIEWTVTQQAS